MVKCDSLCSSTHHRITETQNGWGWEEVFLVQTPSSIRVSYSRLPRTMSIHVLNFSTDRGSIASWGNLFQWPSHSASFWSTSLSAYLISTSSASLCRCLPAGVKSHFKVKVNDIHYFPLIHQASHLIIEGYQLGEVWFLLCKSSGWLLSATFLSSMCLEMVLRAFLLSQGHQWGWLACSYPDLPWHSWRYKVTFAAFQPLGTSPDYHDLSKISESGLAITSASSHNSHRCNPPGPVDLCSSKLLKCSQPGPLPRRENLPRSIY